MELTKQLEKEKSDSEQLRKQLSEQMKEWERQRDSWELEQFRAMEKERRKWEEREARLVSQLEATKRLSDVEPEDRSVVESQPVVGDPVSQSTVSQPSESIAGEVTLSQPPPSPGTRSSREEPNIVQPISQPLLLEAVLIAQQMPQIPKFTGEQTGDHEGFQEWGS